MGTYPEISYELATDELGRIRIIRFCHAVCHANTSNLEGPQQMP